MADVVHGVGDEQERVGDQLGPAGVVLADPCLLEPERVRQPQDVEVALEGGGRVLSGRAVVRREEDAEGFPGQSASFSRWSVQSDRRARRAASRRLATPSLVRIAETW